MNYLLRRFKQKFILMLSVALFVTSFGFVGVQKASAYIPYGYNDPDYSYASIFDFPPNITNLASISDDGKIVTINDAGSKISYYDFSANQLYSKVFDGTASYVSGDGKKLFAYNTSKLYMIDLPSGTPVLVSGVDTNPSAPVAINYDGSYISYVVNATTNTLKVVDTATKTSISPAFNSGTEDVVNGATMFDKIGKFYFQTKTKTAPYVTSIKSFDTVTKVVSTLFSETSNTSGDIFKLINMNADVSKIMVARNVGATYEIRLYDTSSGTYTTVPMSSYMTTGVTTGEWYASEDLSTIFSKTAGQMINVETGKRVLLDQLSTATRYAVSRDLKTAVFGTGTLGYRFDMSSLINNPGVFPTGVPMQVKFLQYTRPTFKSTAFDVTWAPVKDAEWYLIKRNGSLVATYKNVGSFSSYLYQGRFKYSGIVSTFFDEDTISVIPVNANGEGPEAKIKLSHPSGNNGLVTVGNKNAKIGSYVYFGGRLWQVVNNNYIISKDPLTTMPYGTSFDVANTGSVAYYLNNTLYNTFSAEDKSYIEYRNWTIHDAQAGTVRTIVGANIGLLKDSEYKVLWDITFNNNQSTSTWLLDYWDSTSYRSIGNSDSLSNSPVAAQNFVRPTLYLKPEVLISSGDGTMANPYVIGGSMVLNKPSKLTASDVTSTSVKLDWPSVPGASGYKLFKDGVEVYSGNALSYTDNAVAGNSTYTYGVSAVYGSLQSARTFTSVTTLSNGAIPAPSNFRVTAVTDSSITVSWAKVSNAVGYKFSRNGTVIYNGPLNTFTDGGLEANTSYSYSVVAYDAVPVESSPSLLSATTAMTGGGSGGNSGGGNGGGSNLSSNNYLSDLEVSGVTFSAPFNKSVQAYTSATPVTINSVRVKATSEDPDAVIKVNGNQVASGIDSSPIALSGGSNTLVITVTAPSGAVKNYSVTIDKQLSNVNDLSSIVLEGASLNETFNRNLTDYTANVPNNVTAVRVTVGSYSIYSTIEINDIPVSQNVTSGYLPLEVGDNELNIVVTAQNGDVKTYKVKVTRDGLSSDNKLLNVFFGPIQFNTPFNPDNTLYSAMVSQSTDSVTILPFKNNVHASLAINGIPVNSGSAFGPYPLVAGLNVIKIGVRAQDGSLKEYLFNITRGESSGGSLPDVSNPTAIDFRVTSVDKTSVRLDWNPVDRADGYLISRSGQSPVAVAGQTYFEESGLQEDTDYTYTLVAQNSYGNSVPLTLVVHTLGTPPEAPTSLEATKVYFDSVYLEWAVVPNASSYVVMRDDNKKVYEGQLTVFKDQSVAASKTYSYYVVAKNSSGTSAPVYLNGVTTPAAPVVETTPPVVAEGKVYFEFAVINGAEEYNMNRNPHWKYTLNPDGTFHQTYDNAVTGETKDLGNVAVVNGKLPFTEVGLAPGNYSYKITATVKNPDGSTSTTPGEIIDTNVPTPGGGTSPGGGGTPGGGTPGGGSGNGDGGSGGNPGGGSGGGAGGGGAVTPPSGGSGGGSGSGNTGGAGGNGTGTATDNGTGTGTGNGSGGDTNSSFDKEAGEKPSLRSLTVDNFIARYAGHMPIENSVQLVEKGTTVASISDETTVAKVKEKGLDLRAYYWNVDKKKWVALPSYAEGSSVKFEAMNKNAWVAVFGVKQPSFVDVNEKQWAEQAINYINGLGLVEGYKVPNSKNEMERSYVPNQNITRAEVATIITRVLGGVRNKDEQTLYHKIQLADNSDSLNGFANVPLWAVSYISAAKDAGLVKGVTSSDFAGNKAITRIEAAVMLTRGLNLTGDHTFVELDESQFKDNDQVPFWAIGSVDASLIKGHNGNLRPNDNITRAEFAQMVKNMLTTLGW